MTRNKINSPVLVAATRRINAAQRSLGTRLAQGRTGGGRADVYYFCTHGEIVQHVFYTHTHKNVNF
jgi:hypothetical protein